MKRRSLRFLEICDFHIFIILFATTHARPFLIRISSSVESTHEPRYLKSFTSFSFVPSNSFSSNSSFMLYAMNLVFLALMPRPIFLHSFDIPDWFHANRLSLNVSKTKYMLFSRSHPVQRDETVFKMSDTIIKPIHCIKFLGRCIDERLDWQEHINACRKKLTSVLYAINKVNHFLPVASLKLIYYTLVYPYLMYGIILWGSTYKVHTTKLFIMQKQIVHAILQTSFHEHSHPLFTHLNLIKLQDIY